MSGASEDDDKQFEPSQKKLDDARAKGDIAKSGDLTTAASYAGILLALLTIGPTALVSLATTLQILLEGADEVALGLFAEPATPVLGSVMQQTILGTAPLFAAPAIMAVLSIVAQRAIVFAPSKLAPKLDRISPISGLKNKFGRQGLFEFFKSLTKLIIYGVILGFFLARQMDRIIGSIYLPPAMIVAELGHMIVTLMSLVLLVALVLGVVDFLWQAAEHTRKNMMSRKEMMDEMKQSEGDPMMKQQRRQKGYEIAMNQMLADVPAADVVIVNPTHYAVALKWDRSTGVAPFCVAKGVDEIAAKIREMAHEHAVPLHSDPPTARALHAEVDVGEQIKQEHYRAVAAAIRFSEAIRKKAGH